MKQSTLEFKDDQDFRHYLVNGTDLTISSDDLREHIQKISDHVVQIRLGNAEATTKQLNALLARKAEIRGELERRWLKSQCGAITDRIRTVVRECPDIEWES